MISIRLACEAMATRFELVLHGRVGEARLRAAGEEALDEIRRIEAALSLYRPDSQIAAVNRDAARCPVRVTPEVFGLLRHALMLSQATAGAFDITVAPLMRAWGLMRGSGRVPEASEIELARACTGPDRLRLNEGDFTVGFDRPGVMVDLGSIGKGYALDRAAERLLEAGVTDALLHGGTSTAMALGRPPGLTAWRIAVERPAFAASVAVDDPPLAVIELHDESLSVSAIWGKGFEVEGRFHGHVIDPRSGWPVEGAWLAAMVLPSATESDAVSTALLVRGGEMIDAWREVDPGVRCLVIERVGAAGAGYRVRASGISATVT